MSEVNRIWRLRKRPVGDITDDVLSFEEESIPDPSDGEFLFRLNYLSLDPTMFLKGFVLAVLLCSRTL